MAKILIAEDDLNTLQGLETIISREGHEVLTAASRKTISIHCRDSRRSSPGKGTKSSPPLTVGRPSN